MISKLARGQWPTILTRAGVDPALLDGKHHACPACGGKDRFRFDDQDGRGTFLCNQCGAGDGIILLQNILNTDFLGAVAHVESVLGVTVDKATKPEKQHFKTPADAIAAWPELPPASPSNPYLKRKGVQAHIARQNGDELIIPVCSDLAGTLVSVQRILPEKKGDTDKFFVKGTVKKSNFCLLGEIADDQPLLFCEGFATGASLHEATGAAVIVCFDAGNVYEVAKKLRAELKTTHFVFCGDNDQHGKGQSAAARAGKDFAGAVCIPDFTGYKAGTDFNDLACVAGLPEVAKQVQNASEPTPAALHADEPGAADSAKPETKLPAKFALKHGGLMYGEPDENTGEIEHKFKVCGHLEVSAVTVDGRGQNEGRLLRFKTRRGQWREHAIPMGILFKDLGELTAILAGLGLRIENHKTTKARIAEYINDCEPAQVLTTTEATGWHGSTFVLTGGEIIGDGEKVIFTGADANIYQAQGNLEQWRQNVAALAVGNSRIEFALSLGFAGVLMPLTGDEGAGCNIFGLSSTGKTTTQTMPASIWGSPEPGGFISKWNATATGLEIQAVRRNHTLFCIDELGELDPKIAGRLIYQLASGVQKGRGRAGDGGIGLADLKTWKMPFISSAEKTLSQHIEEAGQRIYGGQAVRCVDIQADAGAGLGVFENLHGLLEQHQGNADAAGAAFSDLIKERTKQYHGTAGRAFVAALLKMGTAAALVFVADKRREFAANVPTDASGLARRAGKLFSLAAAAGELAVHLKILPWQPGAAMKAAARCFNDWLQENAGGNPEERRALSQVAYFLESNHEGFRRWHEKDASDGGRNIARQVGYLSEDETVYYIKPELFKTDVCKGFRPDYVLKLLDKRDALVKSKDRMQYKIRPAYSKVNMWMYAIKSSFAENAAGTAGTTGTTSQEASKNQSFDCTHSVPDLYPQGEFVPAVPAGSFCVPAENHNKNNRVPVVPVVPTQKQPGEKKSYPQIAAILAANGYPLDAGGAIQAWETGLLTESEADLFCDATERYTRKSAKA